MARAVAVVTSGVRSLSGVLQALRQGSSASTRLRPRRHQTVDLPPITPIVSERRLQSVGCRDCGAVTSGTLPPGVPNGMWEPGLMALIGLLTGDYNMSRRRAVSLLPHPGLSGDTTGPAIALACNDHP